MKLSHRYISLSVLLSAGLLLTSSCNKWLDVSPKSEVKSDKLFSTSAGFKDALYGSYSLSSRGTLYGGELTMGFLSAMQQDYNLNNPINYYYSAGNYTYTEDKAKGFIKNIWGDAYNTIANLNNILNQIDAAANVFTGDDYHLVKGEALGMRAYLHFDLLRLFAPSYLAGSGKPGIPYMTTISKVPVPTLSVAQVITQLLKDLTDAAALLENDPIKTPGNSGDLTNDFLLRRSCHFNLYAVKALMARIYLYQGDKANAGKYAQEVINSHVFPFVTDAAIAASETKRDRTFSTEHIFALYISDLANYVNSHFKAGNQYTYLSNADDYINGLFDISAGGSTDYRYAYLWNTDNGQRYSSKFWQIDNAPATLKYLMPLLRISEMYYIAAECSNSPATGYGYLNAVRTHRGLEALPDNGDAAQLQADIQKEYRKEFYAEGQAFFYCKRLNLVALPGTAITGSDKVYVLPLPDDEKEYGK